MFVELYCNPLHTKYVSRFISIFPFIMSLPLTYPSLYFCLIIILSIELRPKFVCFHGWNLFELWPIPFHWTMIMVLNDKNCPFTWWIDLIAFHYSSIGYFPHYALCIGILCLPILTLDSGIIRIAIKLIYGHSWTGNGNPLMHLHSFNILSIKAYIENKLIVWWEEREPCV